MLLNLESVQQTMNSLGQRLCHLLEMPWWTHLQVCFINFLAFPKSREVNSWWVSMPFLALGKHRASHCLQGFVFSSWSQCWNYDTYCLIKSLFSPLMFSCLFMAYFIRINNITEFGNTTACPFSLKGILVTIISKITADIHVENLVCF